MKKKKKGRDPEKRIKKESDLVVKYERRRKERKSRRVNVDIHGKHFEKRKKNMK